MITGCTILSLTPRIRPNIEQNSKDSGISHLKSVELCGPKQGNQTSPALYSKLGNYDKFKFLNK